MQSPPAFLFPSGGTAAAGKPGGGSGGAGGITAPSTGGKPATGGAGSTGSGTASTVEFAMPICAPIQAEMNGAEVVKGGGQTTGGTGGGAKAGAGGGGANSGTAGTSGGTAGRSALLAGAGGGSAAGGTAGKPAAGGAPAPSTGGTGAPSTGGASAPAGGVGTLSQVWEIMTCESCNSTFCHGAAGGLTINEVNKALFYEQLLGTDGLGAPTGMSGACAGMKRVVPGDPEQSVLYLKLAQRAPCGDAMPPPGQDRMQSGFWNARELEVLRSWIAAGAKKDF